MRGIALLFILFYSDDTSTWWAPRTAIVTWWRPRIQPTARDSRSALSTRLRSRGRGAFLRDASPPRSRRRARVRKRSRERPRRGLLLSGPECVDPCEMRRSPIGPELLLGSKNWDKAWDFYLFKTFYEISHLQIKKIKINKDITVYFSFFCQLFCVCLPF